MRNTVRFLEDQQNLDELLKPTLDVITYRIFEPCIIIGDREKLIIGDGSRIDSFTKLEIGAGIRIGEGVHIASFAHVGIGGGYTFIGDYAAVASGAKLISGSNQLDATSLSPLAPEHLFKIVRGSVLMQKFSCVLTNAIVCPGVTLYEGAVLLPNSTATQDLPAWQVWGGSPAKFIKHRVIARVVAEEQ